MTSRRKPELGANLIPGGAVFRLLAPRAKSVELVLLNQNGRQITYEMNRCDDGVWEIFVEGVQAQQRYGFRCHGTWDPSSGLRFNPAKLLVDPYAKAVTAGVDYFGPIHDHISTSVFEADTRDSALFVPHSVVVEPTPAPTPIAKRIPLTESVIYEAHIKGLTQTNPLVPEHLRGTYSGLAYPAVIEHLKKLGITAIELLPVHHFISEPFIISKGRTNYWGYNTLAYFAPHSSYSSIGTTGQQVTEFKTMVSALHEAGIEVIIDVVYNHTAEGGHSGPTLNFRGIDHFGYYRLTNDLLRDYDVSGCGNTLDTSHEGVKNLILDSMRYWVTEMGVDGFRFDLATALIRNEFHDVDQNHPLKQEILSDATFEGIKMIVEPWDVGPFGYQVGKWGQGWSEWNDKYRDEVRDFWRNGSQDMRDIATRLSGSPDLFHHVGRDLSSTINFVTCHDGFTMRDLVSYNIKHNEGNGESNRDGTDANRSWNCGWEGRTDDPQILALRKRQVKNFMATLMLSLGVPMMLAGDEFGNTQEGNNNAYCRDSSVSWLDWNDEFRWLDVESLTSELIKFRRSHKLFTLSNYCHRNEVLCPDGVSFHRPHLAWFCGENGEMSNDHWYDPNRKHFGMYRSDADEAYLVWFNSGPNPVEIQMPGIPWGQHYEVVLYTADPEEIPTSSLLPGDKFVLPYRSVVVMEVTVPKTEEEYISWQESEKAKSAPGSVGDEFIHEHTSDGQLGDAGQREVFRHVGRDNLEFG